MKMSDLVAEEMGRQSRLLREQAVREARQENLHRLRAFLAGTQNPPRAGGRPAPAAGISDHQTVRCSSAPVLRCFSVPGSARISGTVVPG